ncbi:MAG TPA: YncE family protein [Bryobacteraceae bacterium]|nr:YncE family protein [Bryobacteraceae bacterium]
MRLTGKNCTVSALVIGLCLGSAARSQSLQYNPSSAREPLAVPYVNDPPDFFAIPFYATEVPVPLDIPFPPEDTIDGPFLNIAALPGLSITDPFPDMAALFSGELGIAVQAAGANTATPLMPFPMWLPFHPAYSGVDAAPTPRVCDQASGSRLIIPESGSNTVVFVNTCPYQLTKRIITGSTPAAVAETPDGKTAIVSNAGSGTLSFVDVASQTVTSTLTLTVANGLATQPGAIAILPDGSRAYVNDYGPAPGSVVWVIDLASQTVIGQIGVGPFPSSIAVSPDGSQVWVPCHGNNTLYVIDTLTNSVVTFISSITQPNGIAFAPNGARVYVAEGNVTNPQLDVINPATFTIETTIPVGSLPHAVAVSPTGRHVFVANALANTISEISTATNAVIRTINLPELQHPLGLTFIQ